MHYYGHINYIPLLMLLQWFYYWRHGRTFSHVGFISHIINKNHASTYLRRLVWVANGNKNRANKTIIVAYGSPSQSCPMLTSIVLLASQIGWSPELAVKNVGQDKWINPMDRCYRVTTDAETWPFKHLRITLETQNTASKCGALIPNFC